ncbi:MAG: tetratricopeptide repeat protein, partial [Cyanobacteria bacterium P01_D01_bin.56]
SVEAWYNRGVALAALGEYYRAIATYDKVLTLDAANANALTGRGLAWVKLEDYAAATADLEAALALNPEDALAQETLTALATAPTEAIVSTPPPPPIF